MKNSAKVIVPGYGMAVAQAQHALRDGRPAKKAGVEVKYAIHPVAGRMPGHMNASPRPTPYDEVFELEDINNEFAQADVAYDRRQRRHLTRRQRKTRPRLSTACPCCRCGRPVPGMFNKRSLASGYAGIDNPLFYRDNTMMLLGDAKKMTEEIGKALAH